MKKKIEKKIKFDNFLKDLHESQYEKNRHEELEGSEGLCVILNLTLRITYLRTQEVFCVKKYEFLTLL